ncbi:hypothetical protein Hanom_Chr09g00822111 [Helianthus anomalus]
MLNHLLIRSRMKSTLRQELERGRICIKHRNLAINLFLNLSICTNINRSVLGSS